MDASVQFSTKAKPSRNVRYTLGKTADTAEHGRVGVGVDRKGDDFLVHEVGRTTEAIALHAVATAVAGGIIPVSALIAAFRETGKLSQLKSELTKAEK